MLTTSGLVIACGISRTFSAIKLCTAFKASAVPCTRHTRSVVPVEQGRERAHSSDRNEDIPERQAPFNGRRKLRSREWSYGKPGQAGMGSQAMASSWDSEWNPCFIICTSSPSREDGRMMLKCFAMPTAALGRGDRAQLPLPSSCPLPVALATIHSLPLGSRNRELRPATVATVTGTPLSVWLAGSSAHPQGDEGQGPVAMATPESLQ